jgi:upstream activation factor subunit UAF30
MKAPGTGPARKGTSPLHLYGRQDWPGSKQAWSLLQPLNHGFSAVTVSQPPILAWNPSQPCQQSRMTAAKKPASPKNALAKAVQPDEALSAVVGKDPLPRTELTKKLWEYIREHDLQDPKEKRNIRADDKLLPVFDGKKVVNMFEMTKLVNGHVS